MPTEAKEIFEASSKNVRELLTDRGLGLYVPAYQRPFGWDKEKVGKLLEDVLDGFRALITREENFTFLGTVITIHDIHNVTVQPIVRTEVPGKVLTVIDGQQRLTTLLTICVALHKAILSAEGKLIGKRSASDLNGPEVWLDTLTRRLLDDLADAFRELQSRGADGATPVYPRMIRAFDDQWARDSNMSKYVSPIAHLVSQYSDLVDNGKTSEFKPVKRVLVAGDSDLIDRFIQIDRVLKKVAKGLDQTDELLPTMVEIAESKEFQRALVNHDFPGDVVEYAVNDSGESFASLLRLVLVASYALNRVALTVVRGKNEDYAFSVFESLNTTGEPLTAFETFQPRVVSAEGITLYEGSKARMCVDEVKAYLAGFKAGEKLQGATREFLINFALAETGWKLSSGLADQRRYLKDQFERHEKNQDDRLGFLSHLRDAAVFRRNTWDPAVPTLKGLSPETMTDSIRLCLAFLKSLNHGIVIAPLVRFYSADLKSTGDGDSSASSEFESALKAMTAFSILWRASRRTTENIEREYRGLLSGLDMVTGMRPLARTADLHLKNAPTGVPQAGLLKQELLGRLKTHGGVPDKEAWVREAMNVPIYTVSAAVSRMLLLAAYHDADVDKSDPGLVVLGKQSLSPCLTYQGWTEEQFLSLEHVAPQSATPAWLTVDQSEDVGLYDQKETIHRIGNLVLLPRAANSSFGNRSWREKRILCEALGSSTPGSAEMVLKNALEDGVVFAASTAELVNASRHVRHLEALGLKMDAWDYDFLERRSRRLLELAWDQLLPWLAP